MMQIPYFIHVEFAGFQDEANPFTPVDKVELAYYNGQSLQKYEFDCEDDSNDSQKAVWNSIAEWIRSFMKNGWVVPVGWDLRNLVWPALTLNLIRWRESTPGLFMPLEKKWNNMDMIDLKNLVMQGGYNPNWTPKLAEAEAFLVQSPSSKPIDMLFDLYMAFQQVR